MEKLLEIIDSKIDEKIKAERANTQINKETEKEKVKIYKESQEKINELLEKEFKNSHRVIISLLSLISGSLMILIMKLVFNIPN